jgi:hypothetical protein
MVIEEMIKSAPSLRIQSVSRTSQSTMTATGFIDTTSPAPIDAIAIGPLSVTIEKVGDEYVASEPRTGMYGEGDTQAQAIASLQRSLRDLRDTLRGREGHLAPDLVAELEYLDRIL